MAAYQLKHMLLFGVIASIGVGFTINEIFKLKEHKIKFDLFSQKFVFNKSTIRKCFILLLVILLFGTLIAGFNTVNHIEPVTKKLFGVKEASIWLHNNSIEGAKIFSWWDAGHLITFFAERKVACDNRNYFGQLSEVNKNVAEFFLTKDINKGRDLIRKYAPDYLVIYPQLFTQGRVLKAYYNGPQMALDSNLNYNYYGFCKRIDENIVCDGKVLVDYRENKSDFWSLVPNASIDGVKYYFYLGEDFYYMIDEETNNSNLAKIYFESEETSKYYEKVYSQFGTRIFKIKK